MKKITFLVLLVSLINPLFVHAEELSADDKKWLRAYGWIMGRQLERGSSEEFGFNETEKKIMISGVIEGMNNEGGSPIASENDGQKLQEFLEKKAKIQQEVAKAEIEKQSVANKNAAKLFFANLDKNPNVKKTGSGLYYEIKKSGSTEMPKANSTVKIDYVGALIDGTEFDSSKKRGEPAVFNLEGVVPGFKEGLQLIGKGGTIRLYIPSELGYGDQNIPGISAGSTLIFDVDMLDIIKEAPAPKSAK